MGMTGLGMMQSIPIIPENYTLYPVYPNPFNPSTNIKFDLPGNINVSLSVYDINVRLIKILQSYIMESGYHRIVLEAGEISSGIYLVKLQAGSFLNTQNIMLVK